MGNILIIEDDYIQRKNLARMIEEIGGEYKIFEASCSKEAFNIVNNNEIDLFYIDVNLPDISGIDIASEIRKDEKYKFTWMVFLTTNEQYILEAFKKIHCYDYIIKPYDKTSVKEMTKNLMKNCKIKNIMEKPERKFITLDFKGVILKVYADEIIFVEVFLRVCTVHTIMGKYRTSNLSLKKVMEMLDGMNFIKAHKSYVINTDYVREIEKGDGPWRVSFEGYNEIAYIGDKYKGDIVRTIEAIDNRAKRVL